MENGIQTILQYATNYGIWCVLFIYLFYSQQKQNAEREKQLNGIIERQGETLKEISLTLANMNVRLERVEESVLQ